MAKMLTTLVALGVLGCSGGAPPTQTVQPVRAVPPQPARDASGNILTQAVTIPEGMEFSVQTLEFLSSQNAVVGDPIHLEVQNNVLVDGAIAIAAGSPVKGIISSVTHASRMGKAGNISVRIESGETIDGQRIRLRATKAQSTDDKVGSVVALTVLVSPLFLLKKGNDVAYQPGTVITVYTDEKLDVRAWKR
jgi:virulence-associated protein VagC